MKKLQITLTENQAGLIELALETLSRIASGQLEEIISGIELTRGKVFKNFDRRNLAIQLISSKLKKILFPELEENAYYGIGMKEIGYGQVMYEMYKKLQNYRAKNMSFEEAGVLKDEPLHYSDEPIIKIEEI